MTGELNRSCITVKWKFQSKFSPLMFIGLYKNGGTKL